MSVPWNHRAQPIIDTLCQLEEDEPLYIISLGWCLTPDSLTTACVLASIQQHENPDRRVAIWIPITRESWSLYGIEQWLVQCWFKARSSNTLFLFDDTIQPLLQMSNRELRLIVIQQSRADQHTQKTFQNLTRPTIKAALKVVDIFGSIIQDEPIVSILAHTLLLFTRDQLHSLCQAYPLLISMVIRTMLLNTRCFQTMDDQQRHAFCHLVPILQPRHLHLVTQGKQILKRGQQMFHQALTHRLNQAIIQLFAFRTSQPTDDIKIGFPCFPFPLLQKRLAVVSETMSLLTGGEVLVHIVVFGWSIHTPPQQPSSTTTTTDLIQDNVTNTQNKTPTSFERLLLIHGDPDGLSRRIQDEFKAECIFEKDFPMVQSTRSKTHRVLKIISTTQTKNILMYRQLTQLIQIHRQHRGQGKQPIKTTIVRQHERQVPPSSKHLDLRRKQRQKRRQKKHQSSSTTALTRHNQSDPNTVSPPPPTTSWFERAKEWFR